MWSGGVIKSSEGLTEAEAFRLWYEKDDNHASRNGNLTANAGLFFIQDKTYPCQDCCNCKI